MPSLSIVSFIRSMAWAGIEIPVPSATRFIISKLPKTLAASTRLSGPSSSMIALWESGPSHGGVDEGKQVIPAGNTDGDGGVTDSCNV